MKQQDHPPHAWFANHRYFCPFANGFRTWCCGSASSARWNSGYSGGSGAVMLSGSGHGTRAGARYESTYAPPSAPASACSAVSVYGNGKETSTSLL